MALPANYAAIEQEAMMYLDGGWNGWWNSVTTVGRALDVAIIATGIGAGVRTGQALTKLLKTSAGQTLSRTLRGQIQKLFGSRGVAIFAGALDIAMVVGGNSIGNMVAKGLDWADGNKNGYVMG